MSSRQSQLALLQDSVELDASLAESLEESSAVEYGAVFTRPWVVDMILDLVGYSADRDLGAMRAIEPSCGHGSFVVPMVRRLLESCRAHGRDVVGMVGAIEAYDLQPSNVAESRRAVVGELEAFGLSREQSERLATHWIRHSDFLLASHRLDHADFVVGNPPYIRLEAVGEARSAAYRRACATMGGRSDVYVGFFEVGLKALRKDGALAFICADRWMRNQYGQRLRAWIADEFSVETTVEMHDVDAFDQQVSAYPSVVVVRRRRQRTARVVNTTAAFGESSARALVGWPRGDLGDAIEDESFQVAELGSWFKGTSPWPSGSPQRIAAIQALEQRLPTLEDATTGTRVGIGVATGADRVFITTDPPDVEEAQLLPLAMASDTVSGALSWSGHYLVNPWATDGTGLVRLDDYPRLKRYFDAAGEVLRARNVARRRPEQWFRTIDRVDCSLTGRPKLFIPDIKARLHPVLDEGGHYPHHNLYVIQSSGWDLRVLGGLLLSDIAQMFIEAYAVKMRGGYLRFQAQYLRRIRVPHIDTVTTSVAHELALAFDDHDRERATAAALPLYGLGEIPG